MHDVSPAVLEMPYFRSGKTKVQEGVHRRGGGKFVFVLNEANRVPLEDTLAHLEHLHPMASLPLHGFTPMRESLSSDTHQCNPTFFGPNIVVSPVCFWTSAKAASHEKMYTMAAQPGHTRELQHWLNSPTPPLKSNLGTSRLPILKVRNAEKERRHPRPVIRDDSV
ncbi:hypothetical protein EDB92DRAFT_2112847 [Lactarius akahatsu]|uniref:Uncharacterized protein n=1 Tax=Lactarius akahatsu TaxID=416441 RepID=A0AAD4QA67_9AGAM|nr:hypothetical protein EDB92DRAFT_2112847 [Lactarius akahatsu]